jgi:hypothetical protein
MYDEKIALLGGKKKLNNNKLTNLRPVKGNDDRNLLPVVVRKSVVRYRHPFEGNERDFPFLQSYTWNFIDVTPTRPHNNIK